MAAPKRAVSSGFNLGDLSGYSSGGVLAEGDYCLKDFTVQMFQGTKADGSPAGASRLGVMITLVPLAGGEEHTQFYSFGSKAHESWQPNPETGKGLIQVPGGPGTPPNASTNWAVLLKSMYDSGLPQGVLSDDFSVLDGMWVHMANVPEPQERKSFVSKTGEAAVEDKARTIAVVTEIKDDGKPWEGTGGVPEVAAPAKPGPKVVKPVSGPVSGAVQKATTTRTAPASTGPSEDVESAALTGVGEVLADKPKGCTKLILRTGTFKAVSTAHDQKMASAVIDAYFGSDEALNSLISQHGFAVKGPMVVPA